MKQKLNLEIRKKKTTRRHMLPLIIASAVVISGIVTIGLELSDVYEKYSDCNIERCKKSVTIPIQIEDQSTKQSKYAENFENKDQHNLRIQDVELENKRLLLQRDIQREIHLSTKTKPFNYDINDFCILGLSENKKELVILECSNYVFRRAIELAIENGNVSKVISNYDFKNESPTFEVKIKF
ncbi:hypothetical protein QTV49_000283 [Vibrio vulnificus]|nr:hypothetical protein [Vibrio vulnificus]